MMTDFTRKWCPSMWLDEAMPAPQPSPDDFIHQLGLGAFQLRAPDEPEDDEAFVVDILPGQVIEFSAFDDFGEIEVVVNDDLSFTQDRPTPEGATQFCILGDPESMDSSIEAIVRADATTSGELTICAYSWEHRQSFRLEVADDGTARFVPTAGAN